MRTENGDEHPNAILKQIGKDRGSFRRAGEGCADRMKFAAHVARAIDIGPRQRPDRFPTSNLAALHAFAESIDLLGVDPDIEFKQEIVPSAKMIIGNRFRDTGSLGEARQGELFCSLLADHATCNVKELAMPLLVRKTHGSGGCLRFLCDHTEGTYQS